MNESLFDLLTQVTLYEFILAVLVVSAIVGVILSQKKRISKFLDKWRKDKNEEEDFTKLVYTLKSSIEELSKEVKQNQINRDKELLQYRDDSRVIREEMYKVMNKQSEQIKDLTDKFIGMQEKNSKTKRAEIKERIERIYRECHPTKTCTDTQIETLKELIEEYEEHGGTNSFVHTLVEPEMYEWQVIEVVRS